MQPTSRLFQNYCDAEHDVGLVAGDSSDSVAERNTTRLNLALAGQIEGGQFRYFNGRTGPVLYPIQFAAKEFFFAGMVKTNPLIGSAALIGGGGARSYAMLSSYYTNAISGGAMTRWTRIDGETGGPILRSRGYGLYCERIQFNGRPYTTEIGGGQGPSTGTRCDIGIEQEGQNVTLATGGTVLRDCMISDCVYGFCTKPGYYDDNGDFVSDENHADNLIFDNIMFWGCDSCYRSECLQSVCVRMNDIRLATYGGSGNVDTVLCDVVRGGNVWIDGLDITSNKCTLFKVSALAANDYSHLTAYFTCNNFKWDHFAASNDNYLTLFHMSGMDPIYAGTDVSWHKWTVRCTGHIGDSATDPGYDDTRLVVLEDAECTVGVDRTDLLFDIRNLPTTNFTQLGSGPYWYPNAAFRV